MLRGGAVRHASHVSPRAGVGGWCAASCMRCISWCSRSWTLCTASAAPWACQSRWRQASVAVAPGVPPVRPRQGTHLCIHSHSRRAAPAPASTDWRGRQRRPADGLRREGHCAWRELPPGALPGGVASGATARAAAQRCCGIRPTQLPLWFTHLPQPGHGGHAAGCNAGGRRPGQEVPGGSRRRQGGQRRALSCSVLVLLTV